MHPPGADTVLVRYGEIGTKSVRVQSRMEALLADNIRATLDARDLDATVQSGHTRLTVETTAAIEAVTDAVTDVFGVVSASPAVTTAPTLDAIGETLAGVAETHYDGGTFAVRARRAGQPDAHPFSSTDIEETGGEAVWRATQAQGVEPVVDLEEPDLTLFVECREERAFVFVEKREGPGGLPVGTQEPVVALVSGGIDSPVAAWLAMKRGCPVVPLYIDLGEFGGVDHRLRAERTVAALDAYAPEGLQMRVAPGGEGIEAIVAATATCRMPVVRRFMFRIAERVAEQADAVGIVTGEAVGQKSSQTSANLRVTSAVTELPVHRPLLALDKAEITCRAKAIGTYEASTIDAGCYRLAPDGPATRSALSTVEDAEPAAIDRLADEAAERVELIKESASGGLEAGR